MNWTSWLKENVYLASWLALPTAIVIAYIQGRGGGPTEKKAVSWPLKKVIVYLLFLICFPLTLTPWVDASTRILAGFASVPLFLFMLFMSEADWSK